MNVMPVQVAAWDLIKTFNYKFFEWWKIPFPHLKVDDIEESTVDWTRKLDFVMKDKGFMSHATSATFTEYIIKILEKLKDFMSIILALKTKGLEKRHYIKMENDLLEETGIEIQLIPARITLKFLSEHNLNEQRCVEIIKLYAAVAQKEFAIKCSLDQIDSDVMNLPLGMKLY
jgi:aspartate carbamoyltransferase regulatory subunit